MIRMTELSLSEKIAAAKVARQADADTKKSEALKAAEDKVNALVIDIGVALDDANEKIAAAKASKEDSDKIVTKLNGIKSDLSATVEEILTRDKVKDTPAPADGTTPSTPPAPKAPTKKAASSDATDKAGATEEGGAEEHHDSLWGRLTGVTKKLN